MVIYITQCYGSRWNWKAESNEQIVDIARALKWLNKGNAQLIYFKLNLKMFYPHLILI